MSVREAVRRYLRRRRADATDSSVKNWKYRLKLFVEWCEGVGIDPVGDLQRYDLDEYFDVRSATVQPATLEGEMWTLKTFVRYLDQQLGAVENGLAEAVRIPDLDPEDRTDDTTLHTDDALVLLDFYRNDESTRATRGHAFLELAWFTGARQGSLRGLDLRDVNHEEGYVEFHHRPETDTPLKNKTNGERPVALPEESMDVLAEFVETDRYDVEDEHGRKPLLASLKGRPTNNTIRNISYMVTQPCVYSPCPHDRERETCKWTEQIHASKCPSSRSPHKIRTGSITWQLNRGFPPEVVAERVNATVEVIEDHYDWATQEERWKRSRERMRGRREYIDRLNLEADIDE